MRKTNKYYIDNNGNMLGYPMRHRIDKTEVPAEPFHSKLKIVNIWGLNNGFYLVLQDESGKTYTMNDVMFDKYIAQKDVFIEGDFNFYQQGTSFSIGL